MHHIYKRVCYVFWSCWDQMEAQEVAGDRKSWKTLISTATKTSTGWSARLKPPSHRAWKEEIVKGPWRDCECLLWANSNHLGSRLKLDCFRVLLSSCFWPSSLPVRKRVICRNCSLMKFENAKCPLLDTVDISLQIIFVKYVWIEPTNQSHRLEGVCFLFLIVKKKQTSKKSLPNESVDILNIY